MTEQRVSVITLATSDINRSRRFYSEGFGWHPVFATDEILFYQLNGVVLGLYRSDCMAEDMGVDKLPVPGGFAMAHNVRSRGEVEELMKHLADAGGRITRPASEPPHGGLRGYVLDPDGNPWEIAYNAAFPIDDAGNVLFGTGE